MVGDEVGQLLVERRGGVDVDGVAEAEGAVGVGPHTLVAVSNLVGQPRGQGAADVGQLPAVKLAI